MAPVAFGSVLVTGGCGFLGSNIVAALLNEDGTGPITVVSRNPKENKYDGVDYRACDLTDTEKLISVLKEVQPRVVFHVASPTSADPNTPLHMFYEGNVNGTKSLLNAVTQVSTVKAFVYSSSVSVMSGERHDNVPESTPYHKRPGGDCLPYYWSKTLAEQEVLAANRPEKDFKTVALRLCLMYGPGDRQSVPPLVDAVKAGQGNIQLGDGSNELSICSVLGASEAHLLSARALLDPSRAEGRVDGEAFNITDGKPVHFWDYMRTVYRAAGDTTKPENIRIIPAWLAWGLATVAESLYYVATAGRVRPAQLNKTIVVHSIRTFTYDISKARQVLKYKPQPNLEEMAKQAVKREFQRRGETPPASCL